MRPRCRITSTGPQPRATAGSAPRAKHSRGPPCQGPDPGPHCQGPDPDPQLAPGNQPGSRSRPSPSDQGWPRSRSRAPLSGTRSRPSPCGQGPDPGPHCQGPDRPSLSGQEWPGTSLAHSPPAWPAEARGPVSRGSGHQRCPTPGRPRRKGRGVDGGAV